MDLRRSGKENDKGGDEKKKEEKRRRKREIRNNATNLYFLSSFGNCK